MTKTVVLFDLGGTLVEYYDTGEFLPILEAAVQDVSCSLRERGVAPPAWDDVWQRTLDENYEANDYRVRPLEDRLRRIVALEQLDHTEITICDICRTFMGPIFRRARVYEDTLPVLDELRSSGLRTAIVSNTPWGSPADLWYEELDRLAIAPWVDSVVFCRDAGWRKPAPPILSLVLQRLQAGANDCLFMGDDPRWDVVGAQAVGMDVVLVGRKERYPDAGVRRLPDLYGLRHVVAD